MSFGWKHKIVEGCCNFHLIHEIQLVLDVSLDETGIVLAFLDVVPYVEEGVAGGVEPVKNTDPVLIFRVFQVHYWTVLVF